MNAEEWRKKRADAKELLERAQRALAKEQEDQILDQQRNEINTWLTRGETEFECANQCRIFPALRRELEERGFNITEEQCYEDDEREYYVKYIFA